MMNQSLYQLTLEMLLQKGCPQDLAKKAAVIVATDDIRQPNPKQQRIIDECRRTGVYTPEYFKAFIPRSENQQRIISETWQYLVQ